MELVKDLKDFKFGLKLLDYFINYYIVWGRIKFVRWRLIDRRQYKTFPEKRIDTNKEVLCKVLHLNYPIFEHVQILRTTIDGITGTSLTFLMWGLGWYTFTDSWGYNGWDLLK